MEEQLTKEYLNHLNNLKKAQNNFDNKPSRKSATILSNLKNKVFFNSEKYTPEYYKWREQDRQKAQRNFMIEMIECANMVTIEDEFNKGAINNDLRKILHDNNEAKANQLRK